MLGVSLVWELMVKKIRVSIIRKIFLYHTILVHRYILKLIVFIIIYDQLKWETVEFQNKYGKN